MPSPLSGFTHPAASPTSAQLRPATPDTAPPIGSSADDDRPQRSLERPLRRALARVQIKQRPAAPLSPGAAPSPATPPRCSPRRSPAETPSRSPAAARTGVVAQFQVRGDPLLAAARGVRVGPRRHPVCGLLVPGPAQLLAQRRAHSVRDDQAFGSRPPALRPRPAASPPPPGRRRAHVRPPSRPRTPRAPASTATARSRSSSSVRGTATPTAGNDPPGHANCCSCPNPAAAARGSRARRAPSRRDRAGRSPRPRAE